MIVFRNADPGHKLSRWSFDGCLLLYIPQLTLLRRLLCLLPQPPVSVWTAVQH